MENGNFRLFSANGKWKRQTLVCLLQTKTENERLFSLVGKRLTVIDDCFSKRAIYAGRTGDPILTGEGWGLSVAFGKQILLIGAAHLTSAAIGRKVQSDIQ
jgi:hypothetical protein